MINRKPNSNTIPFAVRSFARKMIQFAGPMQVNPTNVNFTSVKAKTAHGISTSKSAKTLPYLYRGMLLNERAFGVQTKHIGIVIKEFREEHGFSQRSFAEMCNTFAAPYGIRVRQGDICNYETGKCSPKLDKYEAIFNGINTYLKSHNFPTMTRHALCGYTTIAR